MSELYRQVSKTRLRRKIRTIDRVYAQLKKGWCTIEDVEGAARVERGQGAWWLDALRAVLTPIERLEEREVEDFNDAALKIRQFRLVKIKGGIERLRRRSENDGVEAGEQDEPEFCQLALL